MDAFELGGHGDATGMGMDIGDGMEDFGGGYEPDLNLEDGLAPDMQACWRWGFGLSVETFRVKSPICAAFLSLEG